MTVEQATNSSGSRPSQSYNNIPDEMKAYRQWICWRLEHREGLPKPTKIPINPSTGFNASVTDPNHWVSFDEAVAVAHNYSGLGFVFTDNDPFAGIDLDATHGDDEAYQRQLKIFREFNSYSELSPSGAGLHIIVKGALPHGRRRSSIEIYSSERYFTCTGNVQLAKPIEDRGELLNLLFNEMGGSKSDAAGEQPDRAAPTDDASIVALLCADPTRAARYNADLKADGGDHSIADLTQCNALARLSGNREQVERIWMASPLGQRHKTQTRQDYRSGTIEKAFNEVPFPSVATNFTVGGERLVPPAPPTANTPTILDAGMWENVPPPPRRYVWAGWVARGQVTYFTGAGGSGKSLLGQSLASAIALGLPFLGHQTTQGVALYVTCEDDANELHRRQAAICAALKQDIKALRLLLGIADLLPIIHAIGKLARRMETSDAARPIYRRSNHRRVARA